MYAVIKTGGKQQKVKAGDVIEVELMHADGDKVELHPILVVDDEGKTHVGKEAQRAVVVAKLVGEQKGEKVKVFKYRPKTGYAKKQGHRQLMTLLEIEDIKLRSRAPRKEAGPASDAGPEAAEGAPAEPAEAE
jgi:large subunit ribosomal protein L21